MKIIYLHQYFKFPNEPGGTRSFDLATGFLNSGHHVEILTSTSNPEFQEGKRWTRIERNGLVLHYIFLPYENNMSYLKRSIIFIKFLYYSILKILSLKGDIVLSTSTPLTIGIPALVKKWVNKTPFIFETRDIWPEAAIAIGAINNKILQQSMYFLEYLIYKNASAIVPLSVDMKESITSRYPKFHTKPIQVIENISEIDRFQNGYDKNTSVLSKKIGFQPRFTILYAGTFGLVNGVNYVIDLAYELKNLDPRIVFVLVGDGAEKKLVIQNASDKGVLNNNVFILEPVSKTELSQLYFECDMGSSFVINIKELWSNSANKYFDTLASGKPVLINYEGWQKDEIGKENIGYVLPPIINQNEVNKFLIYCQSEVLIAKQQENALNIAKKKYATDVALIKYNKLLKDIF